MCFIFLWYTKVAILLSKSEIMTLDPIKLSLSLSHTEWVLLHIKHTHTQHTQHTRTHTYIMHIHVHTRRLCTYTYTHVHYAHTRTHTYIMHLHVHTRTLCTYTITMISMLSLSYDLLGSFGFGLCVCVRERVRGQWWLLGDMAARNASDVAHIVVTWRTAT